MKKNKNILPPKEFAKRVFKYAVFSICLLSFSIGIGILGYHFFGKLEWIDSFYNASMILTGMGPVSTLWNQMQLNYSRRFMLFLAV